MGKGALPESVLFKAEGGLLKEVARYGGDYSVNSLRTFLSSKTGIYLKLEGCIKELDQLAERYVKASSREERDMVLFAAEHWAQHGSEETKEQAQVYVKLMKAALGEGMKAIQKEKERVEKILEENNKK